MIPIIPLILSIRCIRCIREPLTWLRRKRNHTGKVVLLPVVAVFMALSSCEDESAMKQAPQITVDTNPVGAGLTVIGFGLVGAAVVGALGRMLR